MLPSIPLIFNLVKSTVIGTLKVTRPLYIASKTIHMDMVTKPTLIVFPKASIESRKLHVYIN